MHYREYGQTGKKVSIIGFGGMRFTEDEDEGIRAIIRASELGINYFDTAPFYCNDRSEIIFGKAFKEFKKPFFVSTKSSIGGENNASEVRKRVEKSLDRLGTEKIHFLHMWCIMNWEHFEKVIAPGGPYEGALKLKEEGLVDHIVFSAHANGDEIRKMCETKLFEGVLLGYNIFNHNNRYEGIQAARKNKMGVAIMNPLGGGMVPAAAKKLSFLVENTNETVVQAALRFVSSDPGVTVTLAGMGTVAQVEENVNIPNMLACLNRHKVGLHKEAWEFYDFFKKIAKDKFVPAGACVECGICEDRCTQKLSIIEQLKEVVTLFE